ncbi:MAG: hypothetical protein IKX17_02110, partial [Prevotella sp.]|nr:hypothetical protein [Prevotella sp.]
MMIPRCKDNENFDTSEKNRKIISKMLAGMQFLFNFVPSKRKSIITDNPMKNILVIGSTGQIGSELTRE